MKLVIIESPYAGDIEGNTTYARACVRNSLERGEAPIASHLLYPQPGILREDIPSERQWGIMAGLEWKKVADLQAFYVDRGWSGGMLAAFEVAFDSPTREPVVRSLAGLSLGEIILAAPEKVRKVLYAAGLLGGL